MKRFRTLELAENFYFLSENTDIRGNLRDQLLRASSSIALNLAEGNGKQTVKEKKRYYQICYGSLKECQSIIRLAKIEDPRLIKTADHLGASIWKLLKSEIRVI